ncbi:MAG: hypothetical protein KIT81_18080 [Alphaproteobacteria bacterium]|nr:hypothetical protein [Alphaproteobacteria bacterium]
MWKPALRLAAILAISLPCIVRAESTEAPALPHHLALARELLANVAPEANAYTHRGGITFPGDAPGATHSARTDCSGLVHELLRRAGSPAASEMTTLRPRRFHPLAEDFAHSIAREVGFIRLTRIDELQPGDIIAYAWVEPEDARAYGSTGHVMLIDSPPREIAPAGPQVAGLRQHEIRVIDSSRSWLGPDDSRILSPTRRITGLGQGRIRLYATEQGEIVGFARTFRNSKLHPLVPGHWSETRPKAGAIGRPKPPADPLTRRAGAVADSG